MKNYIFILSLALVLGVGCNSVQPTQTDISDSNITSDTVLTHLENKAEPQDAVFMLLVGNTGGLSSAQVLVESDEYAFLGQIYLRESDLRNVLARGGGLPQCYTGTPEIIVWANVNVVEKTGVNDSLPEPEEIRYYEVQINNLNSVNIDATVCS